MCYYLDAQIISIIVEDERKTPLIGANVTIISQVDSTTLYTTTNGNGIAYFTLNRYGHYAVQLSYLGYLPVQVFLTMTEDQTVYRIEMTESQLLLEEVTIVSRRPMLRQDGEKTIVDPTPMLDISTNVLEIMEATPGLFVDQEGGIYLGNTSPAVVFINGREQRLGAQDIANLLRSLPPGSIQHIELIRNPSARYDAATSGGIINIVLKKGIKIGRFGSVQTGFNQGNQGNQFAGMSLFDTGSRSGWYFNFNLNRDAVRNDLEATRASAAPFFLGQETVNTRKSYNGYLGLGFNREWNEKFSFTYDGRFNTSITDAQTLSENDLISFENVLISGTSNLLDNHTPFLSQQHDLGSIFRLDSSGSVIELKLSFSHSTSRTNQKYTNEFVFPAQPPEVGEGDINNSRYFIQLQCDVSKNLPHYISLESGFRMTFMDFDNQSEFFTFVHGMQVSDGLRNNQYQYAESIGAFYIQGSKTFLENFTLKAGVRTEFTRMSGFQILPGSAMFHINRVDWFPYLFFSRRLVTIAGYDLKAFGIYRKTLSRPTYHNLNPAVRILDQYNYESGNPSLTPQFTNNYEVNISMNDYPILALGRNHTTGIISNVLYNDPVNPSLTNSTFDNIGSSIETYFRLVLGLPPVNRYFGVLGAQYNHLNYNGMYSDAPINFQRGSWRMFTFHSFQITRSTKIMASGFFLLNGQMNLMELGDFGQLNLTLTRTMLNKNLHLSLFIRDALRSMNTPFRLQQSDILFEGERYADNQRVGVNLRYQFGIRPKEEQKKGNPFQFDE
ncbi:MAG TPA: outer membrane beta-barrel protein [Saprospiraceae bacterium]|nr:outer membrane beta-barrel protein [Saprospiraceae bacterium]